MTYSDANPYICVCKRLGRVFHKVFLGSGKAKHCNYGDDNDRKRVYDSMVAKLETLAGRVEALNAKQQKRLGRWLDNEEVCEMLCIAKRTLQAYREKRLIPYTQVGHKIYYKPQDVEALLKQSKSKRRNKL